MSKQVNTVTPYERVLLWENGISLPTFYRRLRTYNWEREKALIVPTCKDSLSRRDEPRDDKISFLPYLGDYKLLYDFAKEHNVSLSHAVAIVIRWFFIQNNGGKFRGK